MLKNGFINWCAEIARNIAAVAIYALAISLTLVANPSWGETTKVIARDKSSYKIEKSVLSQNLELVDLVINSEATNKNEKQYWLDILGSMTRPQIEKLADILITERRQLEELAIKFQVKIATLNCKHLLQWRRLQEKQGTLEKREKFIDALSGCDFIEAAVVARKAGNNASPFDIPSKELDEIVMLATKAPITSWAAPPAAGASELVKMKVAISDGGGGIGKTVLLVDGVVVGGQSVRQNSVSESAPVDLVVREFSIPLSAGKHVVEVRTYGADNVVNFRSLKETVTSTFRPLQKPRLFAVVVGIDEYENNQLRLKFAKSDATHVAARLRQQIQNRALYSGGNIVQLLTKAETSKLKIVSAIERIGEQASFDDVFILYVAGHGIHYRENGYFMLTSDVLQQSKDRLIASSIGAQELEQAIAKIKAGKKVIFLDTCNSGKSINAENIVDARGLSEQILVEAMQYKSGASVFAASETTEQALEGYKGHGVFTFALLAALTGEADLDRDGLVTTDEIKVFLEDRVPLLTLQAFGVRQTPRPSVAGQGFPLASYHAPRAR